MIISDFTDWYDKSFEDNFGGRTLRRTNTSLDLISKHRLLRAVFGQYAQDHGTLTELYERHIAKYDVWTSEEYEKEQDSDTAHKVRDDMAVNKGVVVIENGTYGSKTNLHDAIVKFDPATYAVEAIPSRGASLMVVNIGMGHVLTTVDGKPADSRDVESISRFMAGARQIQPRSLQAVIGTPVWSVEFAMASTKEWVPVDISFAPKVPEVFGSVETTIHFEKWYAKYE